MATCKDCLHYEACRHMLSYDADPKFFDTQHVEIDCPAFQPKNDYVKRERGEWVEVYHERYDTWYYDCPLCDDGFATKERVENKPNFCQNCGADMRGSNNA